MVSVKNTNCTARVNFNVATKSNNVNIPQRIKYAAIPVLEVASAQPNFCISSNPTRVNQKLPYDTKAVKPKVFSFFPFHQARQ